MAREETYGFYGWERATVPAVSGDWPGIRTPRDLYSALKHVWSRETCTERMRADWSPENPTLGQCTITSFLAQDIFGGKVLGTPLGDGNYHCYNVVGGCAFDLTSEQFGAETPDYGHSVEQSREAQLSKPGKRERYEALKEGLVRYCRERADAE